MMDKATELAVKYYTLFETAYDAILLLDGNCFVDCNKRAEDMFGTSRDNIIGSSPAKYSPTYQPDGEKSEKKVFKKIRLAIEEGPQSFEWVHKRADGQEFIADVSLNKLTLDNKTLLLGIIRDITIKKQIEASLYESEERFRTLSENSLVGIYIIQDDVYTYVNSAFAQIIQCNVNDLIGTNPLLFFHPDDKANVAKQIALKMTGKLNPTKYQAKVIAKNGDTRNVAIFSSRIYLNTKPAIIGSMLDITEHITAVKNQEKNLQFLQLLTDISSRFLNVKLGELKQEMANGMEKICNMLNIDAVVIWEPYQELNTFVMIDYFRRQSGPILPNNAYSKDYFPWAEEQLKIGQPLVLSSVEKDLPEEAICDKKSHKYYDVKSSLNFPLLGEGKKIIGILSFNTINFERQWTSDDINQLHMVSHLYSNVFSRKISEEKLLESELRFRTISEHSLVGIYIIQQHVITYVNSALADMFGYEVNEMIGMDPLKLIDSRDIDKVLEQKTKREVGQSIESHYEFDGLKKNNDIINIEIYNAKITLNNQPAVIGSVLDITKRKFAEKELQNTYNNLKKTLNDTIITISKIVELRDPYTAGHQERVASLAVVIAKEMGLKTDVIENLRMAAMIHDVGKINIPSELLSKPGKLNTLEKQLIMTHAQSGYDIVKNMNFLPEVAEIILQHHERFDGSGYPQGLKGDEIRIEARILTVSDVIEAMSSHRPYRAALGIETALAEISKNSGVLYDPQVCKVCVEIFKKHKFEFNFHH